MPSESGSTLAQIHLAPDHPSVPGHFPGYPIMPGAVLLERVVDVIGKQGHLIREVRSVKFLRPVPPGGALTVSWVPAGAELKFEARDSQGEIALRGILILGTV